MISPKIKILFLCTGNSCRSQMAEGIVNNIFNDSFEAYSAGTNPSSVNPYSIKVMSELNIDISNYRSKNISKYYGIDFDVVITVCDNAKKVCPIFPGAKKQIHMSFRDPSEAKGPKEQIISEFRLVRDSIYNWLKEILPTII